jgi:hypothetical protein
MMDNKTFTILAADHGGFIVWNEMANMGQMRSILFAGTLDDCLSFIRSKLVNLPRSRTD